MIKAIALLWCIGSINPIGINLTSSQAGHKGMPIKMSAVTRPFKTQDLARLGVVRLVEEEQFDGSCIFRKKAEVYSFRGGGSANGETATGFKAKAHD